MKAKVLAMPVGRDPVWVSEFEYLVRWKGRARRVDIRKLKSLAASCDEMVRVLSIPLPDALGKVSE